MRRFLRPSAPAAVVVLVACLLLLPFVVDAQWGSGGFYKKATCKKPSPESVKAWSGCWKSGSAQEPPTDQNLFVRWKITEKEVRIWRGNPSESEAMIFNDPYFCTVNDRDTLAPERDVDFSKSYTMVYEMHEKPIKEWVELYRNVGSKEGTELRQAADEFIARGGKYIRAWIVMQRQAGWDDDAEEDFWMLPISCEEVEQSKPSHKPQPNPR